MLMGLLPIKHLRWWVIGHVVGHIRSWSTAGVSGQKKFNHNNFIYLL